MNREQVRETVEAVIRVECKHTTTVNEGWLAQRITTEVMGIDKPPTVTREAVSEPRAMANRIYRNLGSWIRDKTPSETKEVLNTIKMTLHEHTPKPPTVTRKALREFALFLAAGFQARCPWIPGATEELVEFLTAASVNVED